VVAVVRYFGGVKLGTGGLLQAYKAASADALDRAKLVECTVDKTFSIRFPYDLMNPVMRVVDEESIGIVEQVFEAECLFTLTVRESKYDDLIKRFQNTYGIEVI
jgi:putative IMPACT (imprinted ancient) family translation regulator